MQSREMSLVFSWSETFLLGLELHLCRVYTARALEPNIEKCGEEKATQHHITWHRYEKCSETTITWPY